MFYMYINRADVFYTFFFFFQAEDGIRDSSVTGVQTCALPILRHPWHLHAADCERAPVAILGQRIDHRQQVTHVGRYAPRDAHAQLNQRGRREQPLFDHLLHEPQVAGIEYFELRLHPQVLGNGGALAQIVRRGNVGAVPVAKIQRAAIERGDVGTIRAFVAEIDDVAHPILLGHEVAAGSRRVLQTMIADDDVAAHAAGEVDDDVDLALADALDDLAVVPGLHAECAGLGIANVDVNDGGAGVCGRDGGGRDLFGRDGAVRALRYLGIVAGDRA